jgi:hypothetical protein
MTNQPTLTVEVTGWVRSTRTNCRSPGNTDPLSISDVGYFVAPASTGTRPFGARHLIAVDCDGDRNHRGQNSDPRTGRRRPLPNDDRYGASSSRDNLTLRVGGGSAPAEPALEADHASI